jgi:hypothetical protein
MNTTVSVINVYIAIKVNNICFNPLNTSWKITVPGKILKFWTVHGTQKLVIVNKIEKLNLADGLCCAFTGALCSKWE